jgi:hypothetical protein
MPQQDSILRQCSKCGEHRSPSEFKIRKNRGGTLGHWCRECSRTYARSRYAARLPSPDNSAFIGHFSRDGVEFREVGAFPGYRVGNDGSVWSCWRRSGPGAGWVIGAAWKPLRPCASKKGHLRVSLHRDGKTTRRLVHHLVLEAFVGPCPNGMEACHFPDWRPSNNHISNLRWDTKQGNWEDRKAHGHGRSWSKLTQESVAAIRQLAIDGMMRKDIAAEFGVSDVQISNILNGKQWKEGT